MSINESIRPTPEDAAAAAPTSAERETAETIIENIWQGAKLFVRERLQSYAKRGKEPIEEMNKEKIFLGKIVRTVEKALKENSEREIIVLFDIDGTIGNPDSPLYENEPGTKLEIRPIITTLFRQYLQSFIKAGKIKVGILSTHTADDTNKRLNGFDELAQLEPFIDRSLIYSTRGREDATDKEFQHQGISLFPNVLDREKAIQNNYVPAVDDLWKLSVLEEIAPRLNDAFILVDDVTYPDYLNTNNHKYYGISVGEESFMAYGI